MVGYGSGCCAGVIMRLLRLLCLTVPRLRTARLAEDRCRLVLVNRAETPVLVLAPPLQLALNLPDFCSIVCRHGEFADEDDEQHFDQRIRRNVRQLSVHYASPSSDLATRSNLRMCNPAARCEQI